MLLHQLENIFQTGKTDETIYRQIYRSKTKTIVLLIRATINRKQIINQKK